MRSRRKKNWHQSQSQLIHYSLKTLKYQKCQPLLSGAVIRHSTQQDNGMRGCVRAWRSTLVTRRSFLLSRLICSIDCSSFIRSVDASDWSDENLLTRDCFSVSRACVLTTQWNQTRRYIELFIGCGIYVLLILYKTKPNVNNQIINVSWPRLQLSIFLMKQLTISL